MPPRNSSAPTLDPDALNGQQVPPPSSPVIGSTAITPATGMPAPPSLYPDIYRWVEVPEYPGFFAEVWVNYPQQLLTDMQGATEEHLLAIMRKLVRQHNHWPDRETGEPLPPAADPAFWERLNRSAPHLNTMLLTLLGTAPRTLPNLATPTPPPTSNGAPPR